jgi:hypothetical protein
MAARPSPQEVEELLGEAGCHPGRDIADDAQELMSFVIDDLAAHDCHLSSFPKAEQFLRSYGNLDVTYPYTADRTEHFTTNSRFCSDVAEEIADLQESIKRPVFPVGTEKIEGGLALIDSKERFFYIHHSGTYYVGKGVHEALANLTVSNFREADEFYV